MVKTIYLLRHAKSSWKDPSLGDFDRPLNKRGRTAAKAMAKELQRSGIAPDVILCSSARRTQETLLYLLKRLPERIRVDCTDALYLASPKDMLERLKALPSSVNSVMLIGHNPGLAELALVLASTKSDHQALDRLTAKYPTGALAVFSGPGNWTDLTKGQASLDAFICPRDLDQ